MRLTLVLLFSLFFCLTGIAQKGSYYVAQYNLAERGMSNYNFDIAQDHRGLIYLANLKGVIVSDGLELSLIKTPYSIFSLDFDIQNNLYVGGRKEIAVIKNVNNLSGKYHRILKVKHEVFDVKYYKNNVYFLSDNTLYIYEIDSKNITTIDTPANDLFTSLTIIENELYVGSDTHGVRALSNGELTPAKIRFPKNTMGLIPSPKGDLFAFTNLGAYFIKKSGTQNFVPFTIEDDGYLDNNTPVDIRWVNEHLLAISTLTGGVVFVDVDTGKVTQSMNFENGLLDNEILTLFVGKNNAVWCATPQGVSVIAPEIPIRNYASYKGLSGNIQVVYNYNNHLYVGTSVGLFELVKKSVFEEVVSYKKITKKENVVVKEEPTKKRGLFKRKSKKQRHQTDSKSKTVYNRRVEKQLLSQSYVYQKVENIDSKVIQLLDFNGKLMIASLSGIYELSEGKASKIFDQPVVYMYQPEGASFLMVSTYNKEIKVLNKYKNEWRETGLLDGLKDLVEQIEKGEDESLWLCGADSLYRIELNSAYSLEDVEVFPIHNPHWERIYASEYKGKTYFLNSSGYYYYEDHTIKEDTLIEQEIGLPERMVLSSNNKLWVNTGHFWYGQGEDLNNSLNFISLFEDPRFISEINDNNFWVVAGGNQVYKIDGNEIKSLSRRFELFLENAQQDSIALPLKSVLGSINQQSSLSFKFVSPDYANIYQTEFQYRLLGLSNQWSEWNRQNNEIVFPYLPAGKYELQVRARDALGNIKNSEAIRFNIMAPYWKRPWFYLAELLFFGGLMTLSVFINRKKHKFSILSRLLTFLTLIFIVEFVQTIAEAKFETNQSPVINFFIQVAIALSILPVEGFLRKFITAKREKNVIEENQKEEEENK